VEAAEGTGNACHHAAKTLWNLSDSFEKHAKAKGAFPKKDASAQSYIWTSFILA